MLFKTARKTQNLRILRGKLKQNVIFWVQIFFKLVLSKINFFFEFVLYEKFIFLQNRAF